MNTDDSAFPSNSTNKKRVWWPIIVLLCLSIPVLTFLLVDMVGNRAPIVDHRNPEAVLRAYFDAWNRNDWSDQKTYLREEFKDSVPEPVESIRLVKLQRIKEDSPTRVTYRVVFDVTVQGHGLSMSTGRYDWTYELTWNKDKNSWLITNYGAC